MNFDFFIKRAINKALKGRDNEPEFHTFNQIKSVVIIFNIEDWDLVHRVVEDLKKNKKNVVAWTVQLPEKKGGARPMKVFSKEVRIIGREDVSWLGLLSSTVVAEFQSLQYDTLFDLTTRQNLLLDYLLTKNTSSFCFGMSESKYKIHNFVVLRDENQDLLDTYQQMKFYLNNINQRTNNL